MPTERSDVRILVTGGCGYVGSKLTEALVSRAGYHVTVLDAMWFGNFLTPHPRLTVLEHDMRRIDAVDLSGFDTIFHLANIANDPAVELNPYASWDVNVLATMRLAERAVRQGVKQIVFASSGSVYGVTPEPRVTEDMPLNPISEYNKTKMVAERVILSYADSLVATIIRPATVCGPSPRMRLDLTVNLLTMQALTRGAMTVLGGSQIRPNIHIDDLVEVYLFALDRRLAGVYNAGFENLSILEIAQRIASRIPAEVRIVASNDPRSYRQCSDRLVTAGFAPARTVSTAIDELADLYAAGRLHDDPASHNVGWMKQHNLS
jgi:nucleoside-diphosphate-sugar epimerase